MAPDLAGRIALGAQPLLRALLLAVTAGWILDLLGRIGRYYYTEQFLAVATGLAAAIVLTDLREVRGLWRGLSLGVAAALLAAFGYVAVSYPSLQLELAAAPPHAVALGVLMVVGLMAAVRRRTGWFLPLLLVALCVFAFVGPHLPENFRTRPVRFERLAVYLALDTNALFGKVLVIATVTVAPFIVFGHLLNGYGGSAVFSDLAGRLVGRTVGGPAKVSVVGSAAFGMVSGSAVANVVAVGSVSIPMMARAGYRRAVAAAIEAVSSTGGQLVPPIMGASAFLMAELLEMPYRDVALAAVLPAVLFYLAVFLGVDFEARRQGIGTAEAGERVEPWAWRYLVSVGVLIWLLFVANRTAPLAGLLSAGALVALHLVGPLGGLWARVVETGRLGLQAMGSVADIVMLGAAAGLVIGVLNLTGLSFAVTLQMIALSGGVLAILLVLVAVLSILLGLGMPTVGVYVLLATLAAPALVELGTERIAAHMYVLYFGMLSMITPPIAIAAFAAATVAQENPWRVAFAALKVGAGVYLVPVAFVLAPELLWVGSLGATAVALARAALAVALVTAAAIGHVRRPLGWPWRVAAGLLSVVVALPVAALGPALGWGATALGAGLMAVAALPGAGGRFGVTAAAGRD